MYPSTILFRETWVQPDHCVFTNMLAKWGFRIFWTYWFYMLFNDPSPIVGHFTLPDPRKWSDAELGIPPDEVGPYADWLRQQDPED